MWSGKNKPRYSPDARPYGETSLVENESIKKLWNEEECVLKESENLSGQSRRTVTVQMVAMTFSGLLLLIYLVFRPKVIHNRLECMNYDYMKNKITKSCGESYILGRKWHVWCMCFCFENIVVGSVIFFNLLVP